MSDKYFINYSIDGHPICYGDLILGKHMILERLNEIQSLQQQIKDLKDKIKLCADTLTEGYYPEEMEYDLQAVNWVHGHLDTGLKLIEMRKE